ncbi:CapA family protein [Viridibacterium curvum]|uniref:Capsule synthesis protein CapA domain-containing protein n=1 Tax=Viridibacterium curvum TaxID=1101404 RepID=A0ABP9QYR5_9RHOO
MLRLLVLLLSLGITTAHAAGPRTLSLAFGGDIMLDDGPGRVIANGGDPLRHIAPWLAGADYRIANLEVPVATVGKPLASKIFTFRARPETLKLVRGRFDAVSVANNHAGDYGKAAFLETLQHLDAYGIARFGGGRNLEEAHAPLWIERNGLRIAVLGYNEFKPRSFEAGPSWPGVAWSEDSHVVADIRAARKAGADLVIPFMHWGWEREPDPTERQRRLARLMIDAGADAVVGTHPHITQGAEIHRGKPIIYSLGNLVFDSFQSDALRTGWLLRLELDAHGVTSWRTQTVFMDADGVPELRDSPSPCGRRGQIEVQQCTP